MDTIEGMVLSAYVTIVVNVPESHANQMRDAMGRAGAGRVGCYSHCSFSFKGVGRFMPLQGSHPHLGVEDSVEEVVEEQIQTVCARELLTHVVEEIKTAHPYEEIVIDIYPIYEIGRKTPSARHIS